MRVVIAGGTGFIGRALCDALVRNGHSVVIVSRTASGRQPVPGITYAPFDGRTGRGWSQFLDGAGALINLAGENIASGYWTRQRKARILESRLAAGKAVMDALSRVATPPEVLVQASATGYYGNRGARPVDEDAAPGTGFLAEVARKWEASTAEAMGLRRVVLRTAVVLGAHGGALPRMAAPFRFFLGGPLGSGRQYFSWIHLADAVAAIRFLMETPDARGPFNLAAPGPVTQNELAAAIGKVLGRPALLRAPAAILRLALGEMARELFLDGARVLPKRLTGLGFSFRFETLDAALADIFASSRVVHV